MPYPDVVATVEPGIVPVAETKPSTVTSMEQSLPTPEAEPESSSPSESKPKETTVEAGSKEETPKKETKDRDEEDFDEKDAHDDSLTSNSLATSRRRNQEVKEISQRIAFLARSFYFVEDYSSDTAVQGMHFTEALLKFLKSSETRMSDLAKGAAKMTEDEEEEKKSKDEQKRLPSLAYHFFPAEKEFEPEGRLVDKNDQFLAHSNSVEPNSLIRAVYSWNETMASSPPVLSNGENPNADHINLISISIFSEPIADFFEKTLGFPKLYHNVVRIGIPFRPLLRNLDAIREHTDNLRKSFKVDDAQVAEPAKETVEEDPQLEAKDDLPFAADSDPDSSEFASFYKPEALGHFDLLLEFVDKYLGKKINLYKRLTTGHGDKIAFEDLWMLFDTGMDIYSPSQEGGVEIIDANDDENIHITQRRSLPQVYRVSATFGGIRLSKSLAPNYRESQADLDYADPDFRQSVFGRNNVNATIPRGRGGPTVTPSQAIKNKFSTLHVMCFYIDFDGSKFGTVTEVFPFKPYTGVVEIRALDAYPVQYYNDERSPDSSTTDLQSILAYDSLLERGRKFLGLTKITHMSYEGLTVASVKEEVDSEIIVDFRTAFEEYNESFETSKPIVPRFHRITRFWPETASGEFLEYYGSCGGSLWCGPNCITDQYPAHEKSKQQKMEAKIKTVLEESGFEKVHHDEDHQRLKTYMEEHDLARLLPGVVPGYALRNRKWVQLDLDLLRKNKVEDGWDRLVLPKGHREMVQAMVEVHARGSNSSDNRRQRKAEMDLVRGKGKGCIILLHGAPGVGKTSTAECVAAYTKRPLYPITCGDIGYIPEEVEKNMEQHFKLARRWGCVLLLDEADVFLAKRGKTDVKRNGLVSVFLRILEYYSGILFLTTNRVGAIDDAFRSRLHLTLYYPKLDKKQTIKIWRTNIKMVEDRNKEREMNGLQSIKYDKKKLVDWLKKRWKILQWNGRQIRNAFQTAIALAEFQAVEGSSEASNLKAPQAPVLGTRFFGLIAEASTQFSDYLLQTHGLDEDGNASRDQIRSAEFKYSDKLKDLEESDDSGSESSAPGSSASLTDEDADESQGHKTDSDSDSDGSDKTEKRKAKDKKKSKKKKEQEKAKLKQKKDKKKNSSK